MLAEFFMNGNRVAYMNIPEVPQLGAVLSIEGHCWRVVDVEIVYKRKQTGMEVVNVYIDVEESKLRRGVRREKSDVPARLN